MSEPELNTDSQPQQKRDSILDNNLAEQVINSSVFRLMLKDIVDELITTRDKQTNQNETDPRISADNFIEEIGDSLILIAQNQAHKKIKEAEKFLNQMYELKVKEIGDRFEALLENKLKQIDEKIKQIEERTRNQSCMISPVKSKIKSPQLAQKSVSDHINKRMQLKQKILNSSFMPQMRHSVNVESVSMLSQSLNDVSFEKLSQKIRSIEQSFKQQSKSQNNKLSTLRNQIKSDITDFETGIKEQMNAGFEGIWNVISNLEKRMMF